MTLVDDYRQAAGDTYDELVDHDGAARPGWHVLGLDSLDASALRAARGLAARLLEDDGVTYTPPPGAGAPGASRATRWRLDPLPSVLDAEAWSRLESGVVQRTELLEAILADLYGPRRLVATRLVPAELLWRHDGYLRPAWGAQPAGVPRLVVTATDLARTSSGEWRVFGDRTQAPSGLGYAMENRRVIARVLPDAYRDAELRRLSTFFNVLRDALVEVAPHALEDPRVVVLTPGRHSETAFDQAFIASLLGFPLVTGGDLTVREGRVWMRELGELRPVDVVIRRVDDTWCDPLELRPASELGVPGLLEAVRRASVVVANGFGVGVVESPAFHPLLPRLAEALLDETLRLASAQTWWCGEGAGLSHVLAHLGRLVVRPLSRSRGRGVFGPALTKAELEELGARIRADPGGYVGQEILDLSTTPVVSSGGLAPRSLNLRTFTVATGSGHVTMPGGLGIVSHGHGQHRARDRVALSKDVWVLKGTGAATEPVGHAGPEHLAGRRASVAMVPRALEDLFWFGRYAERVEDGIRLLLVVRTLAAEFPWGGQDPVPEPGQAAVDVLARTLTHATGTYPGVAGGLRHERQLGSEFRSLLLDRTRVGGLGQSIDALAGAASSVRDQLSADVFRVLGSVDRACGRLAEDRTDHGPQLVDSGVQILSGVLALAGVCAENMVRDVGWQLLDLGRGIERALQTVALIRWTFEEAHAPAVEAHLVGAVLTASESALTHRRRYGGSERIESMLDLLLVDAGNPRSVAFQVRRVRSALGALAGSGRTGRPWRLTEEITELLDRSGASATVRTSPMAGGALFGRRRSDLVQLTQQLEARFRALADALEKEYFQHQAAPRPLALAPVAGGRS